MRRQLAIALVMLVAGCGSSAPAAPAGPARTDARLGLVEWEVTSSAGSLEGGPVTLEVTNAGTSAHDLRVTGASTEAATAVLAPGERATLLVDLAGESEVVLWCSLPGHRAQGMERRVPIAQGPGQRAARSPST